MYCLRACGAGDAKLLAMVGAFVGVQAVISVVLYTMLAGGVLAVLAMVERRVAIGTLANIRRLFTQWRVGAEQGMGGRSTPLALSAAQLPYAVAIAAGTVAAMLRPLFPIT